jgi:hypothetical protein
MTSTERTAGEPTRYRAAFDGEPLAAANVLLLAPSIAEHDDEGCGRLFDTGGDPDAVLHVTLVQPPAIRLRRWRAHTTADPPERVGVVGFRASGGEVTERIPVPDVPTPARVAWSAQPPDLTRIWVAVVDFLEDWAVDGRVVVCVHSLTVLLQYADLERVFRFCHAFASRVRESGATAHYHLDTAAVEDRTVNTLRKVFDATVTATEDGLVRE